MKIRERKRFDKVEIRFEVTLGLAGKSDDQVGPDCGVWPRSEDSLDAIAKIVALVSSPHPRQDLVLARLQRQMHMRTELVALRNHIDNAVAQLLGIERTDSHAFYRASLRDHFEQVGEFDLQVEVLAISTEMNAGENYFLETARVQ